MSDDSDIEMKRVLPKKTLKKQPISPTADMLKKQEVKKLTTKEMIHQALIDLKNRKGTSLYAIKKFIEEKYHVDAEKINYLIKKNLKTSVEMGTIIQIKGAGASGSFKLAPGMNKIEKEKVKKSDKAKKSDKSEKMEKPEISKTEKPKSKTVKKTEEDKISKVPKKIEIKDSKSKKSEVKKSEIKAKVKPKVSKMAKGIQTPAKKRAAMMKRKSIGSIIKPPKMKPKAS